MENTDIKNYVKYTIFAGIIYAVLKVVPTKQLSNLEIMSLVCVILVGIFSLECLTVSKSNENMTDLKETMIDSDAKLFDLDMDIDLDFTKASKGLKENINTTGTKKSLDPLSDIIKKSKDELEDKKETKKKSSTESQKLGIDMTQVEDELSKRIESRKENRQESSGDSRQESREESRGDSRQESRGDSRQESRGESSGDSRQESRGDSRQESRGDSRQESREEDRNGEETIDKKQRLENEVKQKLQTYSEKSAVNCEVEVSKMRRELQDTIAKLKQEISSKNIKDDKSPFAKKYMSILIAELLANKIIERDDVENINAKLISGAVTADELIKSLEKLRSIGRPKKVADVKDRQNDMKYSDLPANYYEPIGDKIANEWNNEYTLLNTDKWQIPQSRPPVCISSGPCKVCPTNTEGYPLNLKEWDDSRVISNTKINKKWAQDQANSS
jgi:hypothetical protein